VVGVLRQLPQLQVGRGLALRTALALACGALALLPTHSAAVRFEDGRVAMGTLFEVTIEAADEATARSAAEAVYAEVERLEALVSSWRPTSEVSRLNAAAGGQPIALHPDVRSVLADSRTLSALTGGAFDVTVGPLVALWTQAGESGVLPAAGAIERARGLVGSSGIEIGGDSARLSRPGMAIDLGGFAKGWALDRLETLLRERGIERALLSFGQSSLLALGAPEGESGWRVLVRGPGGGFSGTATLRDERLSISGSFGKSSTIEGRRFGHVLDPRTGWPASHEAIAVVRAPTAALAEAFSKALLVLDPDDAIAALEAVGGVEGLWMGADAARETDGFREAVGYLEAGDPRPTAGD